jgi:hypothetical protein
VEGVPGGRPPIDADARKVTVGVRFDPEVIDMLDAERARLSSLVPGWKPKRCDAVRALVKEALDGRANPGATVDSVRGGRPLDKKRHTLANSKRVKK